MQKSITPDTLQDIAVCYCMNYLDVLVASLRTIKGDSKDASSAISMLLGNKLLQYYLKCCIKNEQDNVFMYELVQNRHLCNEISVTRQNILSPMHVFQLARNPIGKLDLACFDVDEEIGLAWAYKKLIAKNLANFTSLHLCQKCDMDIMQGFLHILCGYGWNIENFNQQKYIDRIQYDIKKWNTSEDDILQGPVVCEHVAEVIDLIYFEHGHVPDDELQRHTGNENYMDCDQNLSHIEDGGFGSTFKDNINCSMENKNINLVADANVTHEIRNENNDSGDMTTSSSNLKYFFYKQVYRLDKPDIVIILQQLELFLYLNTNIRIFGFISVMYNPVQWFFAEVKIAQLENLQSVTLSFSSLDEDNTSSNFLRFADDFFANLPFLNKLKHLDVSYGLKTKNVYKYSQRQVAAFVNAVKNMPQLNSLDIAGTNLHAVVGHKEIGQNECVDHCMAGFEGRHFVYLGLFNCDNASMHKYIPAQKISGSQTEEQLLVALWSYQHNNTLILNVLDLLLERSMETAHIQGFMDGFIALLKTIGDWDSSYREAVEVEEKIIEKVLLCLYYLSNTDENLMFITIRQKRMLLEQLCLVCHHVCTKQPEYCNNISGIQQNKIVKVSILLIMMLKLEHIAVYSHMFERYVRVLIAIAFSWAYQDVKLLALRLVHSACRIRQDLKEVAGVKLQLVKVLLEYLKEQFGKDTPTEESNEKIWSILWTLTDEVPACCEMFVKYSGCEISKTYIEIYPDNHGLLRKITGALNNVAENFQLHGQLLTADLVQLFRRLLRYKSEDDYDVSSHAAGFLIMLAATVPEAWVIADPSREIILEEIEALIQQWDINRPKGVRFRSLKPMLLQIQNQENPVCQLWGAWLICNLIITKYSVYCDMLVSEGGLTIINNTLTYPHLRHDVVEMLEKIMALCCGMQFCGRSGDKERT